MRYPYGALVRATEKKKRGRPNQYKLNDAPDIWARYNGEGQPIDLIFEPSFSNQQQFVGVVYPDNSSMINIAGWHMQSSCKVIHALTYSNAWLHKNRVWAHGVPVLNQKLFYNETGNFVMPQVFTDLISDVRGRLAAVTPANYTPKAVLMRELETWKPKAAISKNVLSFAQGKADAAVLNDRDVFTCITCVDEIIVRLMEEIAK
jgi:hypothetical protein